MVDAAASPPKAPPGNAHRPTARRSKAQRSKAQQSKALPPTALSVAIDATPLLGARTGVGMMTAALLQRLAADDTIDLSGYVVSWRGRDRHKAVMPEHCRPYWVRLPARVCHRLWRHVDHPTLGSGFDVVHGTNYVVPPAPGAASLVTVHDLTAWRHPELVDRYSAANPLLLERALRRGAHVHCVSHSVADEVTADLGVATDRVHVIPNGVDPTPCGDPHEGRRRIGGRYVVAVGTIEPRKDYVGLVEAMRSVWGQHDDVKLVIIGADGWGVEAFDEAIDRATARSRIVRCGYVDESEKADLLAGAELLVFPSLYEGFGLPLLEAMQAGVPVVSTDVGAIPEVAGDAAMLVPARDADALAEAIIQVIDDTDLRRRLITDGHARPGLFSWDTTASAMTDLYHELAAER